MSEPTIDDIRTELRHAIFNCIFIGTGYKIEGQDVPHEQCQQKACAFAQFGVRTKLITPEEGNDWLDAVWERKVLADVAEKWEGDAQIPTGGAS